MKLSYRSALLPITAVLFAWALQFAHLPAAWFFGPLAASAFFALRDWQAVELPRTVYVAAQAVIGCALGAGFSPATLLTLPKHFAIFAFAVVFILLTSLLNGWLLTRRTRLDVATAFLGTMPGGAGEMAAMSDSLRADSRLVVIMQYTRLLLILASLALVTPFLSHHSSPPRLQVEVTTAMLPAIFVWWKIGALCLLAFIGWLTGMRTRLPAGTFLVPTVLYFLLEISGVQLGRWPWPIFATAYLVMGLQIGGRFRPSTVAAIKGILLPLFVGRHCCYWPDPSSWRGFLPARWASIRSAPIWPRHLVDSTRWQPSRPNCKAIPPSSSRSIWCGCSACSSSGPGWFGLARGGWAHPDGRSAFAVRRSAFGALGLAGKIVYLDLPFE